MSLPRRTPEYAELVTANAVAGDVDVRDDERSASREVLLASDEDVTRAIKRVTRDHRALMTALAR